MNPNSEHYLRDFQNRVEKVNKIVDSFFDLLQGVEGVCVCLSWPDIEAVPAIFAYRDKNGRKDVPTPSVILKLGYSVLDAHAQVNEEMKACLEEYDMRAGQLAELLRERKQELFTPGTPGPAGSQTPGGS